LAMALCFVNYKCVRHNNQNDAYPKLLSGISDQAQLSCLSKLQDSSSICKTLASSYVQLGVISIISRNRSRMYSMGLYPTVHCQLHVL
jgi:hypothetical protein